MKKFPADEHRVGNQGSDHDQYQNREAPTGLMGSDSTQISSRCGELAPHGSQPGLLLGLFLGITLLTAAITLKDNNDIHRDHCLHFFFISMFALYISNICIA